jgi:transposase-like protein
LPRGRRWTPEEEEIIARMYAEGASVEEIAGKLPPDRTVPAVVKQITRMGLGRGGLLSGQSKKSIVPTIEGVEVMSLEDVLKILAGAIKSLQKGGEIDDVELTRLRTMISAIRSYVTVYESFEKYAELEARMKRLEADWEQIIRTKNSRGE